MIAFGGAAGQVACRIAEALDIDEILSPRYASLMSAWGIGQARLRLALRAGLAASLDASGVAAAANVAARLEREARSGLAAQGVDEATISASAAIRYAESDTALKVSMSSLADMTRTFLTEHRRLFGFVENDHPMIIESVEIEAVEVEPAATQGAVGVTRVSSPDDTEALGKVVDGPALSTRGDTQIWVAEGWRARPQADGLMRLVRIHPRHQRLSLDTVADPVTLELFNRRFMGVAEAMGAALERTARSVNIKERLDFLLCAF